MSLIIFSPISDLEPARLEELAYFTAKLAVPVLNARDHAAATNAGSENLWGSRTTVARMDRDGVPQPVERRMLSVGYGHSRDGIAYSTDVHPTLGLRVWEFDTLVVR